MVVLFLHARWADSCWLNAKWGDGLDAGAGVMTAGSQRIAAIADGSSFVFFSLYIHILLDFLQI
ncbi:hypothetical protein Hanom_Chr01g00031051 [Helianthus anomalus]